MLKTYTAPTLETVTITEADHREWQVSDRNSRRSDLSRGSRIAAFVRMDDVILDIINAHGMAVDTSIPQGTPGAPLANELFGEIDDIMYERQRKDGRK